MKLRLALLALPLAALLFSTGCQGQVPPHPTVNSCPLTTGTAYTPLNQSTPAPGLTFTDSKPGAGVYCYVAQSANGVAQISDPSSSAGPFTLNGSNSTSLTWNAPATGPTPTGYIISRAPAIASTILAPALVNGAVAEVKPALIQPSTKEPVIALSRPMKLSGVVR